jgi:hypothetical protein
MLTRHQLKILLALSLGSLVKKVCFADTCIDVSDTYQNTTTRRALIHR